MGTLTGKTRYRVQTTGWWRKVQTLVLQVEEIVTHTDCIGSCVDVWDSKEWRDATLEDLSEGLNHETICARKE